MSVTDDSWAKEMAEAISRDLGTTCHPLVNAQKKDVRLVSVTSGGLLTHAQALPNGRFPGTEPLAVFADEFHVVTDSWSTHGDSGWRSLQEDLLGEGRPVAGVFDPILGLLYVELQSWPSLVLAALDGSSGHLLGAMALDEAHDARHTWLTVVVVHGKGPVLIMDSSNFTPLDFVPALRYETIGLVLERSTEWLTATSRHLVQVVNIAGQCDGDWWRWPATDLADLFSTAGPVAR
jgi:hypothetical protein